MKPISVPSLIAFIIAFFTCSFSHAQNISISASAVWMTDFSQDTVFNVTGTLGNPGNIFAGANFGVHIPNSHTLVFRGGQLTAHSTSGASDVCSARMYYRVYAQGSTPGVFSEIDFFFGEDCEFPPQFNSGGSCSLGDQKFDLYLPDGSTDPYAPTDLTTLPVGNYVIEVYYTIDGLTDCGQTVTLNNGGNNYKAGFSIQNPTLSSTSPTTCNGVDGYITINGIVPNATYSVSYSDDGSPVGASLVADGSGQLIISGLNAGVYSNFKLVYNGTTTNINTNVTLSNPGVAPKFKKIDAFCAGSAPPILPTTSQNGITGTWSPSTVDNQNSGTYTFTPYANQCASTVTIGVTVTPMLTPTFSFGTSLTLCPGTTPPALYKPSDNGIMGSWSPSAINNQNPGTYTFTPNPNQCANSASLTVTINPNVTPTFSFGTSLTICAGNSVPDLPTTSVNGITGTWSPSTVDNQNSGTYTFTPATGQCSTATMTFNVTVNPVVTPVFSFGSSLSICAGGSVPSLPTTSSNGINGTWNPAIADNQNSGTYTFTPAGGQCANSISFNITVTPVITPTFTFGTSLSICSGGSVPLLPGISANGITGTWSPSIVDNQNSGTYTFTPSAGPCMVSTNFVVTVNPVVTPTFSFGTSMAICAGASATLPTISLNGITGTWSPSAIDNQNPGTYTFTPGAGQCATTISVAVTVNPSITPTFSFGTSLSICAGSGVPSLPTISDNGINGTWNPATVSNQNSGTYTFTPSAGQCVNSISFTVIVAQKATPVFSFGSSLSICKAGVVPVLATTSTNGITGVWSPSIVDNQNSGTYTFTPSAGQCAAIANLVVTVNPVATPTFSFGTSITICAGASVPTLPGTSLNGVTGTWVPSVIDNQNNRTYTFTPGTGQCATSTTLIVTVNPIVNPTFSFGTALTICSGSNVPLLPAISNNGITGTWSPLVVNNQISAAYTFTPNAGQCAYSTNFVVTITQNIIPTFDFGNVLTICSGGNVPTLPATSVNGVTGTWTPAIVSNQTSGTYTFTPNTGQCAQGTTFSVTVTTVTVSVNEQDITVTDGAIVPANTFTGTPAGASFRWTNSNSFIGLGTSGTGNVPSFIARNSSANSIKGTITVTPAYNGCTGTAKSYVITVMPLNKEIFLANVFTPNGDGRNDIFYVRGNYIQTIEMRIFNQYGRQIELITDPKKGWDGKYKGTLQPVGVYMYTLKVTMTDGRIVQLKGNVTLIR